MVVAEKYFGQHRSAEVDICKQRNSEAYHIFTQWFCFTCTLECNGQCGGGRHGTDSSQVSRTVMFYDFQRIFTGINTCDGIEQCHPDIMSDHYDENHLDKDREAVW